MGLADGSCSNRGWWWRIANVAEGAIAAGGSWSRGWCSANAAEGTLAREAATGGSWSWDHSWSADEAATGGTRGGRALGLFITPQKASAANCRGSTERARDADSGSGLACRGGGQGREIGAWWRCSRESA